MLFFGNKKIKRAEKYLKIHLEEPKRTKEHSDAVKRHLQPWTNYVGKCQKREIIIVIPTE